MLSQRKVVNLSLVLVVASLTAGCETMKGWMPHKERHAVAMESTDTAAMDENQMSAMRKNMHDQMHEQMMSDMEACMTMMSKAGDGGPMKMEGKMEMDTGSGMGMGDTSNHDQMMQERHQRMMEHMKACMEERDHMHMEGMQMDNGKPAPDTE